MTLKEFKKSLKLSSVIIFLVAYGVGTYSIGKSANITSILKVSGVSTQKPIEAPVESPVPYTDTQSSKVMASFVKLCSNTLYGFEVSYKKDWITTYNTEADKCMYFAPYSFVLPYETSSFLIPIKIEIVNPDDWAGTVKFNENPNDFYNIISTEDVEIGGRTVKKIESKSTGAGQVSRNFVKTTYLIENEKLPIVLTYQQLEEKEDVADTKSTVEDMVASLNYF